MGKSCREKKNNQNLTSQVFGAKKEVRLCSASICLLNHSHLPSPWHSTMQGGFLRNQRAITGVYYINPAAFTWASTILIAEAVFLTGTSAVCVHMQFSTASPMHVYNKAFHPLSGSCTQEMSCSEPLG